MNPATGEVAGEVGFATPADVDHAVATARQAFAGWRATSLSKRTRILFKFRELLHAQRHELADLVTAEHGKVLSDALGEIQRGLEVVEFACGIPHMLKGGFSQQVSTGVDSYSIRQPVGTMVGVTPFNFPVMVPMWMHPVAIACGNTFVLKPSEKDPSASIFVAKLYAEAGLPEGVFNVVQGDGDAVRALLDHPDVSGVSFVGSTPVARSIYGRASANGKRVQALGGAKNHMVVLPDADLDVTADAAVSAGYGSAGERCMAISVVVAVGSVGDDLVEKIADRAKSLRIGPGDDHTSEMGPLITRSHRDRVAMLVDSGIDAGADLVVDGRDFTVERYPNGYWLGPCLFDHVAPDMKIYQEEIFGPVLLVVRVDTFDEAVDLVNANPYGNGTAIFTNDGGAARRFEAEITAGMVGLNVPIPVPMAYFSFGGSKDSLFGDSHIHGPEGVHFNTLGKTVVRRWPDRAASTEGVDLGFPGQR